MTRFLGHLKSNAVAYLALFVALGGTSYAAISVPRSSVGSRQLKNHSISPIKLNPHSIGGYVRYWARIGDQGLVEASRPKVGVVIWNGGPNGFIGGIIRWSGDVSTACFSLVNAEAVSPVATADSIIATGGGHTDVNVSLSAGVPVDVAVVCPQP